MKCDLNKLKTMNVDDLEIAIDALRALTEAAQSLMDARDEFERNPDDLGTAIASAENYLERAFSDLEAAGL